MKYAANKQQSAKQFRRNTSKTKAANMMPARGGFRL